MTFYLKYRPQRLEDLDMTSVRETLQKIVASGNIPHAILFAGTKGTGKTSAARILAKIINCEEKNAKSRPCNECDQCLSITKGTNIDVIELDAASNRGIDDIRILRDAVKLAPASARKKIYIIDEAHMLTTEASNALLKTLEEPPAHVHFILATTNPEKLIDTIRSRTTLVKFTKATKEEILRSLSKIVKSENLKIKESELERIYSLSRGSFRDAVKTLENFATGASIESMSGFNADDIFPFLENGDKKTLLEKAGEINMDSLMQKLNQELLATEGIGERSSGLDQSQIVKLIELLIIASEQSKYSPIEELPLQIAFLKYFNDSPNVSNGQDKGGKEVEVEVVSIKEVVNVVETKESKKLEEVAANTDTVFIDPEPIKEEAQTKQPVMPETQVKTQVDGPTLKKMTDGEWEKILKAVRPVNASIEALLRASRPLGFDGSNLLLGVYYKFHKERLDEVRNKRILEDVVTSIFNNPIRVSCELADIPKEVVKKVELIDPLPPPTQADITKVAEEVFGS